VQHKYAEEEFPNLPEIKEDVRLPFAAHDIDLKQHENWHKAFKFLSSVRDPPGPIRITHFDAHCDLFFRCSKLNR
jgi:hypothetical protein